jgi:glycosyltransferase involved in cell wall biosynthesis
MGLLFSIIIPVHNSEKYLSESLKSVLGQTYSKKKYEIIIVDDYSTDGSEKIIKNFKRKFKNIKVVNNKMNKKVSYSRNIGIKNAKGRYIVFLDSDDQLKKYSLSNIESILQRKEHDLILCLEFKSNKWKINPSKVKQLKDVNSFIDYENKKNFYNPNCWNMIIKRSFLLRKKILFKKIDIFEDQVFCIEVLLNADLLKIIPGTFYNYIQRPFSLSRKTNILALNSCLHALINFYYLTKKFNLTKNRIVFVKKRINFILNNIIKKNITNHTAGLWF